MLQRCLAIALGVFVSEILLASQGFAQAFVPPPDRRPGPGIAALPVGLFGPAARKRAVLGSCQLIPLWFRKDLERVVAARQRALEPSAPKGSRAPRLSADRCRTAS